MSKLIYVAGSSITIPQVVVSFLEANDFEIQIFEDGNQLYDAFEREHCSLAIIDVAMPHSCGYQIAEKIRTISKTSVVLTEFDSVEDRLRLHLLA